MKKQLSSPLQSDLIGRLNAFFYKNEKTTRFLIEIKKLFIPELCAAEIDWPTKLNQLRFIGWQIENNIK